MSNSYRYVGLDLGYGNCKIVAGNSWSATVDRVMPSGAAPIRQVDSSLNGTRQGFEVRVRGEAWVAGVDPSSIQGDFTRNLEREYFDSANYVALFHAALLAVDASDVELLVTGLPSSQANQPELKQRVVALLKGRHEIAEGRFCTVKQVLVVAQPMGAITEWGVRNPKLTHRKDLTLVSIDPGYGTVDHVVVHQHQIRKESSNSTASAMSRVLERAKIDMEAAYPSTRVDVNRLDLVLRSPGSDGTIMLGRYGEVNVRPYVEAAAKAVSESAIRAIRSTLRAENFNVDYVILTGGGAPWYAAAVKEAFPAAVIEVADNPVMANARGFFVLASQHRVA